MRILGLSLNPEGYDPSACVVIDGALVAAAEEERWSKRKHEGSGEPKAAAAWCLAAGGMEADEIDVLAYGWNYSRFIDGSPLSSASDPRNPGWFGGRHLRRDITHYYCEHHKAHAYGAWQSSGFAPDAVVLVVDGSGERESSSVWIPDPVTGLLERRTAFPLGYSMGFMYEAACLFMGWHTLDGGKVMGLSSYGKPRHEIPSVFDAPDHTGKPEVDQYLSALEFWKGIYRNVSGCEERPRARTSLERNHPYFSEYADLAASVQFRLEEDLYQLAVTALRQTPARKTICLGGGVGINCVANGKLRARLKKHHPDAELYVQNPPGDAGVSVGAAVAAAKELQGIEVPMAPNSFLGPTPASRAAADQARRDGLKVLELDRASGQIERLLSAGQIIGVCDGAMEFGPRALGHRSFLSRADRHSFGAALNDLKRRESWRPSAPIMTEAAAKDLLEDSYLSESMLFSFVASEGMQGEYPAAVHVDGTSRAQVVADMNGSPASKLILETADRHLGHRMLLNTSLNVDAPIALDERDALGLLNDNQDLPAMIVGDTFICKELQ